METKSSMVVARGWEEERDRGHSFFNGYRDVLRNNVNVLNTLHIRLKTVKTVNFMLYVFDHNF